MIHRSISTIVCALFYLFLICDGKSIVHDQRQEGGTNVRADFSKLDFLIIPTQNMVKESVHLLDLIDMIMSRSRAAQKLNQKNHHSTIKQHETDTNEIQKFSPDHTLRLGRLTLINEEPTTTKKDLNKEFNSSTGEFDSKKKNEKEEKVKEPMKEVDEKESDNDKDDKKKEDKKDVPQMTEELLLVQEGLEECGPDGSRDQNGMCVFPA